MVRSTHRNSTQNVTINATGFTSRLYPNYNTSVDLLASLYPTGFVITLNIYNYLNTSLIASTSTYINHTGATNTNNPLTDSIYNYINFTSNSTSVRFLITDLSYLHIPANYTRTINQTN